MKGFLALKLVILRNCKGISLFTSSMDACIECTTRHICFSGQYLINAEIIDKNTNEIS